MNIKQVKDFLNKLSGDFNNNKISLQLDGKDYNISDFYLTANTLIVEGEEQKFKDTIFDDTVVTTLRCIDWNRNTKLAMVKALKSTIGLGLKDAKRIIDEDIPFIVATGKTSEEYNSIKTEFPPGTIFEED